MAVLFGTLFFIVLFLYIRERTANRNLNHEVGYVKERLAVMTADLSATEEGYLLVPSGNAGVRALAAQLNTLLETFYQQRVEYQNARRSMEQMFTNISHDLRTPLTVLKGYSELLVRESQTSMAMKIDQKADELVTTINEYFTVAKIESGDRKADLKWMNITQLCHEVILDFYDILEKAGYEVEVGIDETPLFAYMDGEALGRILKNLVDNAIKHGGAGKYLGIRLYSFTEKAVIEIEDHGPGISEREQERIFTRNYTSARKSAGNGLGLAIARGLAQQIGAKIEVTSEPDVKTVFEVTLPGKCILLEKS